MKIHLEILTITANRSIASCALCCLIFSVSCTPKPEITGVRIMDGGLEISCWHSMHGELDAVELWGSESEVEFSESVYVSIEDHASSKGIEPLGDLFAVTIKLEGSSRKRFTLMPKALIPAYNYYYIAAYSKDKQLYLLDSRNVTKQVRKLRTMQQ